MKELLGGVWASAALAGRFAVAGSPVPLAIRG
jgi:hypothetical protein